GHTRLRDGLILNIVGRVCSEVARAEMPHISRLFQPFERFRNLFGFHQSVRSVEHEQVEVIGAEALEDTVDGSDDMLSGQIIVFNVLSRRLAVPYAAFALKDDVVPMQLFLQDFTELRLAFSFSVDVRMIEVVDALLQSCMQVLRQRPVVKLVDAHASQYDPGS